MCLKILHLIFCFCFALFCWASLLPAALLSTFSTNQLQNHKVHKSKPKICLKSNFQKFQTKFVKTEFKTKFQWLCDCVWENRPSSVEQKSVFTQHQTQKCQTSRFEWLIWVASWKNVNFLSQIPHSNILRGFYAIVICPECIHVK